MGLKGGIFDELRELVQKKAVLRGEFILASGKKSNYYIDARLVTLSPLGASLIGPAVLEAVKDEIMEGRIQAVGGMSIGADPIATAVCLASMKQRTPLVAFIVRKETKDHGTGKRIEGPLEKGMRTIIVEDVTTTGGSAIKAIGAVREFGCEVYAVVSLIDRQEGAEEELKKHNVKFIPLISKDELIL
ncbi:MAG: orotate phosphoribosyltransferase [bacterium]